MASKRRGEAGGSVSSCDESEDEVIEETINAEFDSVAVEESDWNSLCVLLRQV